MQTAMTEFTPVASRCAPGETGQGVAPNLFRSGMSRLGGACTIITSNHVGERAGLTATAVCSVSAEPPRLLVCINRNVRAHQIIASGGALGVNVLDVCHQELAMRFAGMVDGIFGDDRFLEGSWEFGVTGIPILRDALVSFECKVIEETTSGTHSIFLCEVIDVGTSKDSTSALVYFNRNFVPIQLS